MINEALEDETYSKQTVFNGEASVLNQRNCSKFKNRRMIRGMKNRFISPDQISRCQLRLELQRTNLKFKSRFRSMQEK